MIIDDNFEEWFELKKKLNANSKLPYFQEREIWWCSVGLNVGFEIYGKGKLFSRPVLVIKKYGQTFFAIPLSSKIKNRSNYFSFRYKDKLIVAVLDQAKTIDAKRLAGKIGRLGTADYKAIKKAFIESL